MVLHYDFNGETHRMEVNWSREKHFAIFQNIFEDMAMCYKIKSNHYYLIAKELDFLADKLYHQLYDKPEHQSISYSPAYARLLDEILNDIKAKIIEIPIEDIGRAFFALYWSVFGNICRFVDVFLKDNTYQNKMLKRREESLETSGNKHTITEFEYSLLDKKSLEDLLSCLTPKQKIA